MTKRIAEDMQNEDVARFIKEGRQLRIYSRFEPDGKILSSLCFSNQRLAVAHLEKVKNEMPEKFTITGCIQPVSYYLSNVLRENPESLQSLEVDKTPSLIVCKAIVVIKYPETFYFYARDEELDLIMSKLSRLIKNRVEIGVIIRHEIMESGEEVYDSWKEIKKAITNKVLK